MRSIFPFFTLITCCLFSFTTFSQNGMSSDEKEIRQIVADMQNGWNQKSGEQFATHFSNDHDYVVWSGLYNVNMDRASNVRAHQFLFEGVYKNMDITLKADKVRFIKPDVAMVHTYVNTRKDENTGPDYPEFLITMLLVKNDGAWQIVSFNNLDIEYDQLLHRPEPTEAEKQAYAKEGFPGWYHE